MPAEGCGCSVAGQQAQSSPLRIRACSKPPACCRSVHGMAQPNCNLHLTCPWGLPPLSPACPLRSMGKHHLCDPEGKTLDEFSKCYKEKKHGPADAVHGCRAPGAAGGRGEGAGGGVGAGQEARVHDVQPARRRLAQAPQVSGPPAAASDCASARSDVCLPTSIGLL